MPDRERDAARTRRLVLDAAARAVAAHGSGVSLDVVARAAGVSKGGLLHHFRSREALLLALAEDLVERFRADVAAAVDPRDQAPGRLVRGYVNAVVDDLLAPPAAAEHALLYAALTVVPAVAELLRRDKQWWDRAFADDGLHPQRALLVVRAADGAGVAGLYEGGEDPEELERTRLLLLALTRVDGPLVGP